MSFRLLPRSGWLRKIVLVIYATAAVPAVLIFVVVLRIGTGDYSENKTRSAEMRARAIRAATQNWQAAMNSTSCPTIEQLVSEKHLDPGTTPLDAWGHGFILECAKDEVYVTSIGPDGKPGTTDDIRIPKTDPN